MGCYVKVARTDDVPPGRSRLVTLAGRRVALFNVQGTIHAIEDACPHMGGPLSDGD